MQELSEFRLKCFQLLQSEKGMKVSLDALIFAAAIEKKRQTALEIGAGTGIVSLVLAQDSITDITAVEIDPYIDEKKLVIAKDYLLPNIIKEHGLQEN